MLCRRRQGTRFMDLATTESMAATESLIQLVHATTTFAEMSRVDQLAQFAQRVLAFGRHPLYKVDVAKHRPLEILCASHLRCLVPHRRRVSHGTGDKTVGKGLFRLHANYTHIDLCQRK